ncbi:MAG: SAF domain-containing protein [Candidatus Nanopelagicales bacterium]
MSFFSKNLTKVTNFILNLKRELATAFLISALLIGLGPLFTRIGTETVLIAAGDLSAGATLSEADYEVVYLPAKHKAPNAIDEEEIKNLSLASNIQKGEQLTRSRFLAISNSDESLVPIRIFDSQIAKIIQPGQLVDVVASSERDLKAKLLAKSVRVVALYPESQAFTNSQGILLLVATTSEDAVELAGSGNLKLSIVIRNK